MIVDKEENENHPCHRALKRLDVHTEDTLRWYFLRSHHRDAMFFYVNAQLHISINVLMSLAAIGCIGIAIQQRPGVMCLRIHHAIIELKVIFRKLHATRFYFDRPKDYTNTDTNAIRPFIYQYTNAITVLPSSNMLRPQACMNPHVPDHKWERIHPIHHSLNLPHDAQNHQPFLHTFWPGVTMGTIPWKTMTHHRTTLQKVRAKRKRQSDSVEKPCSSNRYREALIRNTRSGRVKIHMAGCD